MNFEEFIKENEFPVDMLTPVDQKTVRLEVIPVEALRDYQSSLEVDIQAAWQVCRNVMAVSPTGSGKTVLFSDILLAHNYVTHHGDFLDACKIARANAVTQEDADYWAHQIDILNNLKPAPDGPKGPLG